jgi:hypothetical protein
MKKKVKGPKKIKVMGEVMGGLWLIYLDHLCVLLKSLTGGGEVSGGGTHYM